MPLILRKITNDLEKIMHPNRIPKKVSKDPKLATSLLLKPDIFL